MSPRKKEILHIYRRVSTKGQEGKYSLGIQLKKGKSLSKKLGLDYKDWSEGGKSGSSENIEERELLSELFLHIQELVSFPSIKIKLCKSLPFLVLRLRIFLTSVLLIIKLHHYWSMIRA